MTASASRHGSVITFYSYKGGTGRTMSLANAACIIARKLGKGDEGGKVLAIDWDFEAPGLHKYLESFTESDGVTLAAMPGCLELFEQLYASRGKFGSTDPTANRAAAKIWLDERGLEAYSIATSIPGLSFIKAGCFDQTYATRAGQFKWEELFLNTQGMFSGVADYFRATYDYVLIDSRTGVSDTSGICTMLLPDKLVVAFTPNHQSLDGLVDWVTKAIEYRGASDVESPLFVFPLPSRLELSRPEMLHLWRRGTADLSFCGYQYTFESLFKRLYKIPQCDLSTYFDAISLHHVADYAFGEPVASEIERDSARTNLSTAYRTFVDHLIELSFPWESLSEARECHDVCTKLDEVQRLASQQQHSIALREANALIGYLSLASVRERVFETLMSVASGSGEHDPEVARGLLIELLRRAVESIEHDNGYEVIHFLDVLKANNGAIRVRPPLDSVTAVIQKWSAEQLGASRLPVVCAEVLSKMGHREQGLELLDKVYKACVAAYGEKHTSTDQVARAYDEWLEFSVKINSGAPHVARSLLTRLASLRTSYRGEDHAKTQEAKSQLQTMERAARPTGPQPMWPKGRF
jgi:hypothetical protein